MNRVVENPQLSKLATALISRIGQQRFDVWFSKSARFDLRNDSLEVNVANEFISDWIGGHFVGPLREAAHEVFGSALPVRFNVVPQLFEAGGETSKSAKANGSAVNGSAAGHGNGGRDAQPGKSDGKALPPSVSPSAPDRDRRPQLSVNTGMLGVDIAGPPTAGAKQRPTNGHAARLANVAAARASSPAELSGPILGEPSTVSFALGRLRHDLLEYVVGPSNHLAYNIASYVCDFPGGQYNPLFVHGGCGLGKTHLLQGICRRFTEKHPTRKWMYLTGEEFTNDYLTHLRHSKLDAFRRRMRELDLLVIDDVHFLAGKRATQEEFLHTFNAIEATGRQVVMASDAHPRQIQEFGESLVNRFISGMVVRIDPPNYAMRCDILRLMARKASVTLSGEVVDWIARRVTQNVRELEGALTRVRALARLDARPPTLDIVCQALGDLDVRTNMPLRPESILGSVCEYFGLQNRELMSGRRQRTISLARSVAMYLVRKNSRLSFPEIAVKLGKRNHSTVISACRRIEKAVHQNDTLCWESNVGDRADEAQELIQRLEEQARAASTVG